MTDWNETREKRLKYEADVAFEVWMQGGNPDNVDLDRVDDDFYDGVWPEDSASAEYRRQRRG